MIEESEQRKGEATLSPRRTDFKSPELSGSSSPRSESTNVSTEEEAENGDSERARGAMNSDEACVDYQDHICAQDNR